MPSLPRTDGDDVCLTTRDTPWCPVAYDAAKMLGTRVAETILCRRRPPRDRRYGCKAKVRSKGACKTGGRPDMGTTGASNLVIVVGRLTLQVTDKCHEGKRD
jgi:hypothetical protein